MFIGVPRNQQLPVLIFCEICDFGAQRRYEMQTKTQHDFIASVRVDWSVPATVTESDVNPWTAKPPKKD